MTTISALRPVLILPLATILIVASGKPEERAAAYMEKAQSLFDQGDYVEAKLEA